MNTADLEFNNKIERINSILNDEDVKNIKNAINDYCSIPTEELNLLFTGSTLCGKSTTIKMLEKEAIKYLDIQIPDIDYPEINNSPFPSFRKNTFITKYQAIRNITCWETLGFGLYHNSDILILNQIKNIMDIPTQSIGGKYLIDLAIIVHDYSFSDWRTTYNICNDLNYDQRILLAINQKENPSPDNVFSPEIPPILEDMCNKKNIEIVYYNSHDDANVKRLLFSIITLINARKESYPLLIINDESEPLMDTNNGSLSNSSTLIPQLRAWGEANGFTAVMDTICDTFEKYDRASSISNDLTALLFSPNAKKKILSFTHLILTLLAFIWNGPNRKTINERPHGTFD